MTVHVKMFNQPSQYRRPLVWHGVWRTPEGLCLMGFHVWSRKGSWCGVYQTKSRATVEATLLS